MSLLTLSKIVTVIGVVALFIWTFKDSKQHEPDTLKYGSYMLFLLVLEVAINVLYERV
ncbi:Uncharacterised protein [Bacillus paralicheniformis]|nr:putative membrane protein [Bacillus paralicheniformis]KUL16481.1 hypothetical protein LI6934_15375 [Bacillus licheniformis LMG 6934]GIN79134.1 hypothetical protein J41TS8_41750 [Bacillus sp. J41TS8]VEB17274.1 Uncharacterised protein [Bacillus paralicheniformis]GIN46264.1 hypothetical protein J23TS8_38310 [Bacillus paralicheniformis]